MGSDITKRLKANLRMGNYNISCSFPKNMLLETTNMCNDSCLFCANSKCTKKKGIMDIKLAEKILKQSYELGVREVGFYGTGEPLLDNNLEHYIEFARHLGYEYVYITTNGALLSKERAKTVIEAGIDSIKFSINASNAKDYWLIHGRDEFDKVIENIIQLDILRKEMRTHVASYISYVVTRYTNINKDEFKMKYQEYVDDIVFYDCVDQSGCMTDEIKKYLCIDNNIGYHPQNDICPIIFNNLYVTYEGFLTLCCADFQNYLAISDLNKVSLKDAWNNQYAQELRRRHLSGELEGTLCFNCIHDCNTKVEPLCPEMAIPYDNESWSKEEEIMQRIEQWKML